MWPIRGYGILTRTLPVSLVIAIPCAAQNPGSIKGLATPNPSATRGISVTSPYAVGAQLGYTIGSGGDFSSDLVASGLVIYTPTKDPHLNLSLASNLSVINATDLKNADAVRQKLKELVNSGRGLEARLYVTWQGTSPNGSATAVQPVLWVSSGIRLNAAKDTSAASATYIGQLRGTIGAEARWYTKGQDVNQPITASAEFTSGFLTSADAQSLLRLPTKTNLTLEGTTIIPFSAAFNASQGGFQHFALLAQAVLGLNNGLPSYGRLGVLIAKS